MREKFGCRAVDKVTGFEGIVTGYAAYITGCDQLCLTPQAKQDGSLQDGRWFDINRVQITNPHPVVTLDTTEDKGGPTGAEQARIY